MRLGSARLGSSSSRLGGAGAAAAAASGGGIWIAYPFRLIAHAAIAWIDSAGFAGLETPAVAAVSGAQGAERITTTASATIDGDHAARRAESPPAYIER